MDISEYEDAAGEECNFKIYNCNNSVVTLWTSKTGTSKTDQLWYNDLEELEDRKLKGDFL